ncbi:protein kish-A [Copidosoma floridanum]|uniref:protein kish-A n=1 Tax=Copidosoma floridanum TaxID=29053 RepID=UPI0006C9535B|nr:protein kish-A [Copidosoma floridanum]
MFALFNFQSLLVILLLVICTSVYVRLMIPNLLDKNKKGILGMFWKFSRIGERKSPYVAACCLLMSLSILLWT